MGLIEANWGLVLGFLWLNTHWLSKAKDSNYCLNNERAADEELLLPIGIDYKN